MKSDCGEDYRSAQVLLPTPCIFVVLQAGTLAASLPGASAFWLASSLDYQSVYDRRVGCSQRSSAFGPRLVSKALAFEGRTGHVT